MLILRYEETAKVTARKNISMDWGGVFSSNLLYQVLVGVASQYFGGVSAEFP